MLEVGLDLEITILSITELNSLLSDPTSTDPELRSLAHTDLSSLTTTTLPSLSTALKRALLPPHPFSPLPSLLEIHPGAGGSEASIFASELLRMYQTFCSRRNWRTTMLKEDRADSDGGGGTALLDAVMEVHAPGSYDLLRVEAGVHRVQRVPATEKKGRTHTSAVSVLVLPGLPDAGAAGDLDYDNPSSDYYVATTDVRAETMKARGAGGQHVNTTDSAVRLTHIPTGIVVGMQEERSQHKNREKAWRVLRAKLAQQRREQREEEARQLRRKVMGGVGKTDRGDKVRTYNFDQDRVSDHRCGVEVRGLRGVMEGGEGLERLMVGVGEWGVEEEVRGLVAAEEGERREREEKEKGEGRGKKAR
ncbi:MAG: hypothetical protein Q9160_001487 [Pyrenula sp. 1 TL-2023]